MEREDGTYYVNLDSLIENLSLTEAFVPEDRDGIEIIKAEVNRPGLVFAHFYEHYDRERIQIVGKAEYFYLLSLSEDEQRESLHNFFSTKPVCVVFTTNIEVFPSAIEAAKEFSVPILKSPEKTSDFMAALISHLNVQLAPRMTMHGVFVEVYGEGLLILGDSGIGKSETAIELVKRGHRLIADDAVEIKKVSATTLVGSAPEIIRHYIELRGIGIVDVRRIFGMGAVKLTERVDFIINLELWEQGKFYDRFGMDTVYTELMGIKIPSTIIPVKPGRNLAVIIEIAAMNNRQKKMGYNTAVEFNKKLIGEMTDDKER